MPHQARNEGSPEERGDFSPRRRCALFFLDAGAMNLSTKGYNNHRRDLRCSELRNFAHMPWSTPGAYRFWVRNDSVLTTTCGSLLRSTTQFVRELPEAMRQRASIRDDH